MKETLSFQLGISVLEGPARQKQIKYMNIVLVATTVFIAVVSFFILAILRESDFRLGLILTALIINVSSWITLKRGNLRFSGLSLVLGYWVLSTFVIAQTGGLYSPWLLTQFSIIVLAGLLAGGLNKYLVES